ncbi:MAG: glycosyltransferase family 4 protein [Candidatus Hydrogenedentota bacterium]
MKIGMIIQNFYPYIGGSEKQCLRLSEYLTETLGLEVDIITRKIEKSQPRYQKINTNLNVIRLDLAGYPTSTNVFMLILFWYLIRNIKKYDIMHIHLISSHTISALLTAKLFRKKTIVKLAASGEFGDIATSSCSLIGKLKLLLTRWLADRFVAPSAGVKQEMLDSSFNENKIKVIPNMIREDKNYNKTYHYKEIINIVFIARLTEQKSPETLIHSLNKIKSHKFICKIVGGGVLKSILQEMVKNYGLIDKIYFTGEVNDVIPYLKEADIFISTSLSEGLPNSILEAGMVGLPVIATDISGNNEIIINNYNGFLFEPKNVNQLCEKISFFINNKDKIKEFGTRLQKLIMEKYTFESNIEKIKNLYEIVVPYK